MEIHGNRISQHPHRPQRDSMLQADFRRLHLATRMIIGICMERDSGDGGGKLSGSGMDAHQDSAEFGADVIPP